MQKQLAIWNSARDVWEKPNTESILCGHLGVYSETWPTSGITRNGVAYELPTWEHRTDGSESSSSPQEGERLFPTPNTMDSLPPRSGEAMERQLRRGEGESASRRSTMGNLREDILQVVDPHVFDPAPELLLPTPVAQHSGNKPEDHLRKKPGRKAVTDLAILVENGLLETGGQLLPTPDAYAGTRGGSQSPAKKRAGGHAVNLQDVIEHEIKLLPTPTSRDHKDSQIRREPHRPNDTDTLSRALTDVDDQPPATNWGKYSEAVHRWERIHGEAPPPTEIGANGKHRLNPAFAQWMMGLDLGHVTDVPGISRANQLKAIGNGVVPQQAAAALRDMLNQ